MRVQVAGEWRDEMVPEGERDIGPNQEWVSQAELMRRVRLFGHSHRIEIFGMALMNWEKVKLMTAKTKVDVEAVVEELKENRFRVRLDLLLDWTTLLYESLAQCDMASKEALCPTGLK